MTLLRLLVARIGALFGRRRMEGRLDEEIQAHLELLVEENLRRGMSPEEARYTARRAFGGIQQIKETYRDNRGVSWIETTLRDARYAARLLRKSPGFTVMVTSVLALGIGATATVSSLRNTIFLRPLPYPEPERMVLAGEAPVKNGRPAGFGAVRYLNFADWRAQNQVFDEMAAWRSEVVNVNLGLEAIRVSLDSVSEGFFPMLGMKPLVGRTFAPGDFAPGAPLVAVLSHAWWKADFGARPAAVGQTIRIDGHPATIVGVMPSSFRSPVLVGVSKFWTPLSPASRGLDREARGFQVAARLRRGVALDRARGDMATIAARLERQYPESNKECGVQIVGMHEEFAAAANSNVTLVFSVGAIFVLLIACANAANLLLARGIERRKEIALRMAMGAGRWRLVRQFVMEGLLLALAAGAAGLVLAYQATAALSRAAGPILQSVGVERFEISRPVLGFTLVVSLGTALAFGLVSTLATAQRDLSHTLNEGGRTVSAGRSKRRLIRTLVVAELMLATMLLVSVAFVSKSLYEFWRLDWGFPLDHRIALTVSLSEATHKTDEARLRFFHEVLQRAGSLKGVRSAALASSLPIELAAPVSPVKVEAAAGARQASLTSAAFLAVSPDYLQTLSIPLVRGRMFSEEDTAVSPRVVVLNASMARRFWNNSDPLGARIEMAGQWRTVVGVAGDIINQGLFSRPGYEVLLPYTQAPSTSMTLLVHTAVDAAPMLPAAKGAIRSVDPDQAVSDLSTMEAMHAELSKPFALILGPLLVFSASALLLATVGIYGVISHSVSARTREIGIRMALGAPKSRVISQVLGEGARLTAGGLLLGVLGATLITRVLVARVWWLHGAGFEWPLLVAALLAAVAAAACYIPASRAARIDPVETLRGE